MVRICRVPPNHVVVKDGRLFKAGEWIASFSQVYAYDISEVIHRVETPKGLALVRWKPDVDNLHAYDLTGDDAGVLRKVTEILSVRPYEDLSQHQSVLGVIFTTPQPLGKEPPPPPAPKPDAPAMTFKIQDPFERDFEALLADVATVAARQPQWEEYELKYPELFGPNASKKQKELAERLRTRFEKHLGAITTKGL